MASTDERVHKHLRRLERVWVDWPIYFITTCTFERRPILSSSDIAAIFVQEWWTAHQRHGWAIGRYVIMPDHVHFFCRAELSAKPLRIFMQKWKQWTSKRIGRDIPRVGIGNAGRKRLERSGRRNFSIIFCARARATARNGNTLKRIQSVLDW